MPRTNRAIFFCTPVHKTRCTFFSSLLSTCTSHLARSHPELAHVQAAHGLTALEGLVCRGVLGGIQTAGATRIFVCDVCREYCLTLEEAVGHYKEAPHAENTAVVRREFGNVGVTRMVKKRMRAYVVLEAEEAEEAVEQEEEGEQEEEEEAELEDVFEPAIISISGVGTPMLAETVVQLADMIRRGSGPVVGGWARVMRAGNVKVHFDHRDGTSGVCTVRNDEKVAELKNVMVFGVVKVDGEEEEE